MRNIAEMRLYRKNATDGSFEEIALSVDAVLPGEVVYRVKEGRVSTHYLVKLSGETRLYGVSNLTHQIVKNFEIVHSELEERLQEGFLLPNLSIVSLTETEIKTLCAMDLEKASEAEIKKNLARLIATAKSEIARPKVGEVLSLERQVTERYHAKTFEALDQLLSDFTIEKAIIFLKNHWDETKSTPLCYTARPEDFMTFLLCQMAEALSRVKNVSAISLLMPGVKTDSEFPGSFPDLDRIPIKEVLQTYILSDQAAHLIPVALFQKEFPSLTRDAQNAYANPVKIEQSFGEIISPYSGELGAYLTENELDRLSLHNEHLHRMMNIKKEYDKASTNKDTLLGQLTILVARLSANSAYGGRGTKEIAATGAFSAISDFNAFYENLDVQTKALIPDSLKTQIDLLINLASTKQVPYEFVVLDEPLPSDLKKGVIYLEKNAEGKWQCHLISYRNANVSEILPDNMTQTDQDVILNFLREKQHIPESRQYYFSQAEQMDTCTAARSSALRKEINDHAEKLDTIRISVESTDKKVSDLKNAYVYEQEDLENWLKNTERDSGKDHYGFSARLLTLLNIPASAFLQTDNQIEELLLLSPDEIAEITKLPGASLQIIKAIGALENWAVFIAIHQSGGKLSALLKGISADFFNQQSGIVKTLSEFSELLSPFTPEKIKVVFSSFQKEIYDVLRGAVNFEMLLKNLAPDQRDAVCIVWIKSVGDFEKVLKYLSKDQRNAVCIALKDEIPDWIKSADDFKKVLPWLSVEQCRDVCIALKNEIPDWIKSAGDFEKVLQCLSEDKRNAVCIALKDEIPDWIKSADDFVKVLRWLSEDQRNAVCIALKDEIPDWIKSVDDFVKVLRWLSVEQCRDVCIALKNEIPDWIKSADDFGGLLFRLSLVGQCDTVFSVLKDQLLDWIKSIDDFINILRYLSSDQRSAVFSVLKDRLPGWIKNIDDLKLLLSFPSVSNLFDKNIDCSISDSGNIELKDIILSKFLNYIQKAREGRFNITGWSRDSEKTKLKILDALAVCVKVLASKDLNEVKAYLQAHLKKNKEIEGKDKNVFFQKVTSSRYEQCLSDCINVVSREEKALERKGMR